MLKTARDITEADALVAIIERAIKRNDQDWKMVIRQMTEERISSYDIVYLWLAYRAHAPLGIFRRRYSNQEDDQCFECGSHTIMFELWGNMNVYPRDPSWLRRNATLAAHDDNDLSFDLCHECAKRYM